MKGRPTSSPAYRLKVGHYGLQAKAPLSPGAPLSGTHAGLAKPISLVSRWGCSGIEDSNFQAFASPSNADAGIDISPVVEPRLPLVTFAYRRKSSPYRATDLAKSDHRLPPHPNRRTSAQTSISSGRRI